MPGGGRAGDKLRGAVECVRRRRPSYKLKFSGAPRWVRYVALRRLMTGIVRSAPRKLSLVWAVKVAFHVALLFLGMVLAYELRRALPLSWWLTEPDAVRVLRWAALYALIGAAVELVFQSERSSWRFASMHEVVGLMRSVSITTLVFLGLIFFIDRGIELPRSVLPLAWLVSLALLVGLRMAWRLPRDPSLATYFVPNRWTRHSPDHVPMLLVGPMDAVDRQIRLLHGDPRSPYRPIGVVTTSREELGIRVHGVPVVGAVGSWTPGHSGLTVSGAPHHALVFLEDPIQAYGFTTEQIGALRRSGHVLLRPQRLAELSETSGSGNVLQEIPLEDFLPRKPVTLDSEPVRALVTGRRILVTGAGGSIGSEVCRQLLALGCSHLTMLDHSEFSLFEINRELGSAYPTASKRAVLGNVRDAMRINEIFAAEKPELVFHAAALKHVELVEKNSSEGVLTNVLGTWNVLRASADNGVSQFVLISTDKAVSPSSVMGATKRVAEALLELEVSKGMRVSAVRFGNVLGSAGSVVPIFREQIARGGPVTVTHPDVNRYFMTIPEAVQLVLHSTAICARRDSPEPTKFLLEMGEPVRIADLARQMITLSGKIPDIDIALKFTGLKPGEKLTEVLSSEQEAVASCGEGIAEISWSGAEGFFSPAEIRKLREALEQSRLDPLEHLVRAILERATVAANVAETA